jgi:hypothetical protein
MRLKSRYNDAAILTFVHLITGMAATDGRALLRTT